MGPSWAISGILGPSWAISGPSRGHPTSILRHFRLTTSEDGRCIADFAKFAPRLHETPILGFMVTICGLSSPSWRRLLAVLRPSPGRLGAILGPSWLILGPLRATLGRLGPSRGEDRRRQSRFCKIRISPTREHHSGVVSRLQLGPFWGHHWPSRGHLVHIDHLGVILGLSCVISVLRLLKTDDA